MDDGWNDVLTVKSDKPLMKLILGAGGQNIEVQNLHPSVRWKQLVSQISLHVVNLWTHIIVIYNINGHILLLYNVHNLGIFYFAKCYMHI